MHEAILAEAEAAEAGDPKRIWEERYEDIRAFERYLARQGYLILKFFLHVSKKEQKERFLERLDRPEKNWKFSLADAQERGHWDAYAARVRGHDPRDRRPPRAVVRRAGGQEVVHAARGGGRRPRGPRPLDLAYPKVDEAKKKELVAARAALDGGKGNGKGKGKAK